MKNQDLLCYVMSCHGSFFLSLLASLVGCLVTVFGLLVLALHLVFLSLYNKQVLRTSHASQVICL